ncbi:MAG TPA: hypothetical protein GX498_09565, partial [Clostridiales bacterium]|nr:hypothetical protein [Clostridiales bacterium]
AKEKVKREVKYICLECNTEELIPEDIVRIFDISDDGDIEEPPCFRCENCGVPMVPEDYTGVDGIHYTIDDYR